MSIRRVAAVLVVALATIATSCGHVFTVVRQYRLSALPAAFSLPQTAQGDGYALKREKPSRVPDFCAGFSTYKVSRRHEGKRYFYVRIDSSSAPTLELAFGYLRQGQPDLGLESEQAIWADATARVLMQGSGVQPAVPTDGVMRLKDAYTWCARQHWALGPFTKPAGVNPIITPESSSRFHSPMTDSVVAWEAYATFNPAAVVRDGRVFLLYRAEDASGERQIGGHTSRLGLAESTDGLHFTRRATPVLYPDTDAQRKNEWPGGVEDPRIVQSDDGTYILTYTQWNRDVPRLAVATSRDLLTWTKHGPAFARASGGKYLRSESKSGAILSRKKGDRLIATRVNGKYWMYWGVPTIRLATSENLLDWTPVEDSAGQAVPALSARPRGFDSWLVEAGPPALITEAGIVVLYNAGDSATRTYSAGQALFDRANPMRLLARSDTAFIRPTESYERTGQYTQGTTFVEALVPFKGKWFLYYGTADSRVAVAVWDPQRR